ncbi:MULTISPECIES: hypothetical protein [unclassified Lentimonas]|uniref:hypothetical protein n=1 Tax=unclassified Lentimonas TaxID=2630993 RepID=UPI001389E63E|nr:MULTISPECIES: hypothetical protein [unclassified Lentimonas]
MAVNQHRPTMSNPGPSWGYWIIASGEKYLPACIFRTGLNIGIFIAMLFMHQQRRASAAYWTALTGRKPSLFEQFRHFAAFTEGLVMKLRASRQLPHFEFAPEAHKSGFLELCASPKSALLGTFHVGYSDMMGCMLSGFDRQIRMVRLRVGNSLDTEKIASTFAGKVGFLWVDNHEEFIFRLKDAIQSGELIGLQCDRLEFASKTDVFDFIGERRAFPMTIYHLAYLFQCPVVFSFTGPLQRSGKIEVYTSPVFHPCESKQANAAASKSHFQAVLDVLQSYLRKNPELWFNFIPLNREVSDRDV